MTADERDVLHDLRGGVPVPAPDYEWQEGCIPPVRGWRIVYKYLGLADAVLHADAESCFAANAVCRRVYSRYPTNRAGDYAPLTVPEPLDPADLSDGLCDDADAGPNLDPDDVPAAGDGGDPDPGSGPAPAAVPGDHGDAGGEQGVLLGSGNAHADPDPELPDVRHAGASGVLPEAGLT